MLHYADVVNARPAKATKPWHKKEEIIGDYDRGRHVRSHDLQCVWDLGEMFKFWPSRGRLNRQTKTNSYVDLYVDYIIRNRNSF